MAAAGGRAGEWHRGVVGDSLRRENFVVCAGSQLCSIKLSSLIVRVSTRIDAVSSQALAGLAAGTTDPTRTTVKVGTTVIARRTLISGTIEPAAHPLRSQYIL